MTWRVKRIELILSLLLFFSIACIRLYYFEDVSHSPDSTGTNLSIESVADNGYLPINIYREENVIYNNIFSPRGMVVNNEGQILPMKGLGESFFYGLIYAPFKEFLSLGEILIILDSTFIFLFTLLVDYLAFLIFRKRSSNLFLISCLIIILGLETRRIINDYSLFAFVAIFFLSKWLKKEKPRDIKNLFFSSIFISFSILFRYEYAILLLSIIFIFVVLILKKQLEIKYLLIFLIAPFFAIFSIFITNKIFYDNFFTFPYMLGYKAQSVFGDPEHYLVEKVKKIAKLFLINGFRPEIFIKNFYYYVVLLFPAIFLPFLLSIHKFKKIIHLGLLLSIFFYLIAYYGSNPNFYSYDADKSYSSYVRYFSPIYLFLFTGSLYFYIKISNYCFKNSYISKAFFLLLLFLLSLSTYFNRNYSYFKRDKIYSEKYIPEMIEKIPPGSVVFTTHFDKFIYRHYQVATPSNKIANFTHFLQTAERYKQDNQNRHIIFLPKDEFEKNEIFEYFNDKFTVDCEKVPFSEVCEIKISQ